MSMWFSHNLSHKIVGCLKGKATQGASPGIFSGTLGITAI